MKATIKRADGSIVEFDGSPEEVASAINAIKEGAQAATAWPLYPLYPVLPVTPNAPQWIPAPLYPRDCPTGEPQIICNADQGGRDFEH